MAQADGDGDGHTWSSPFQIADFWERAKPGGSLILLDERYTGDRSMIRPRIGLKGAPGKTITVKALNDGQMKNNGESQRRTVCWPMSQRIIDAMKLAGYDDPVDVTETIFKLGGGQIGNTGLEGNRQSWVIG